ncbi:MAG TPA: type II secretion system F family protein [Acidimicrobiales bacterium]|nr:type II secretion system F family protein [Acidimicrobiales bacterium]
MRAPFRFRDLRLAALVVLVVSLFAGFAGIARADDDKRLVIRSVDAVKWPDAKVTVLPIGPAPSPSSYTITENGKQISAVTASSLTDAGVGVGIVYMVDTSSSMGKEEAMDKVKAALNDAVARRAANQQIAIVSFGVTARVVSNFTTNTTTLTQAIATIRPSLERPESVERDGMRTALSLLDDTALQGNVVVFQAGGDDVSTSTDGEVQGDLLDSDVVVYGVGLDTGELSSGSLQSQVSATQGTYTQLDDMSKVGDATAVIDGTINAQVLLAYSGDPQASTVDLIVAAGDESAHATFNPGSVTTGAALSPSVYNPPLAGGPSFLDGTAGKYLGGLLALAALILLAYGIGLIFFRDRSELDSALQPYADTYVSDSDEDEDPNSGGLAQTKVLQRAVELTGQFAESRGFLARVESSLERADMPLRAAEALFFYVATTVVVTALVLVLSQNLIITAIVLALFIFVPPLYLNNRARKRQAAFLAQLPDTLQLLSGSLRAGYSLQQGVEAVSQEVEDPMGRELRRVMVEARLGRPLETALDDAAARMGSPDFEWAVMAIRIQREVGGNLAELLMIVSETMLQRERLRRDVKALTAEGRISAIVLALLPPLLGFAMYVINPDYIRTLFDTTVGNLLILGGIVLALIGFFWMKKVIEIEV